MRLAKIETGLMNGVTWPTNGKRRAKFMAPINEQKQHSYEQLANQVFREMSIGQRAGFTSNLSLSELTEHGVYSLTNSKARKLLAGLQAQMTSTGSCLTGSSGLTTLKPASGTRTLKPEVIVSRRMLGRPNLKRMPWAFPNFLVIPVLFALALLIGLGFPYLLGILFR